MSSVDLVVRGANVIDGMGLLDSHVAIDNDNIFAVGDIAQSTTNQW